MVASINKFYFIVNAFGGCITFETYAEANHFAYFVNKWHDALDNEDMDSANLLKEIIYKLWQVDASDYFKIGMIRKYINDDITLLGVLD